MPSAFHATSRHACNKTTEIVGGRLKNEGSMVSESNAREKSLCAQSHRSSRKSCTCAVLKCTVSSWQSSRALACPSPCMRFKWERTHLSHQLGACDVQASEHCTRLKARLCPLHDSYIPPLVSVDYATDLGSWPHCCT